MRWTRAALLTRAPTRTAKSCGPDAPTLASSWRKQFCRRRWQTSPVTEESAKETVKTIARGMPGDSGVTVVTILVCSFYFACEAAGASSARHSLRPLISEGRKFKGITRTHRAAGISLSCPDLPPSLSSFGGLAPRARRSLGVDGIRASIHLRKKFFRRRWITGSSPVMTILKTVRIVAV
jgi:hypothetical protein